MDIDKKNRYLRPPPPLMSLSYVYPRPNTSPINMAPMYPPPPYMRGSQQRSPELHQLYNPMRFHSPLRYRNDNYFRGAGNASLFSRAPYRPPLFPLPCYPNNYRGQDVYEQSRIHLQQLIHLREKRKGQGNQGIRNDAIDAPQYAVPQPAQPQDSIVPVKSANSQVTDVVEEIPVSIPVPVREEGIKREKRILKILDPNTGESIINGGRTTISVTEPRQKHSSSVDLHSDEYGFLPVNIYQEPLNSMDSIFNVDAVSESSAAIKIEDDVTALELEIAKMKSQIDRIKSYQRAIHNCSDDDIFGECDLVTETEPQQEHYSPNDLHGSGNALLSINTSQKPYPSEKLESISNVEAASESFGAIKTENVSKSDDLTEIKPITARSEFYKKITRESDRAVIGESSLVNETEPQQEHYSPDDLDGNGYVSSPIDTTQEPPPMENLESISNVEGASESSKAITIENASKSDDLDTIKSRTARSEFYKKIIRASDRAVIGESSLVNETEPQQEHYSPDDLDGNGYVSSPIDTTQEPPPMENLESISNVEGASESSKAITIENASKSDDVDAIKSRTARSEFFQKQTNRSDGAVAVTGESSKLLRSWSSEVSNMMATASNELVFSKEALASVTYMDIQRATELLETLELSNLKIQFRVFTRPLYSNTNLDASRAAQNSNGESKVGVLKKNVYYLARKTKNLEDVLAQLVQFGVLTFEDREAVMLKKYSLVKAVFMYWIVITKDPSMFSVLLEVLKMTENDEITKLMDDNLLGEATNSEEINLTDIRVEMENRHDPKPKSSIATCLSKWDCRSCTFSNDVGYEICQVCGRSMNFDDDSDENACLECNTCTLINEPGVKVCDACGTFLRDQVLTECNP